MTAPLFRLERDVARAYRRDGYVVVPGLFRPHDLAGVAADMVETFEHRARALKLDLPPVTSPAGLPDHLAFSELLGGLFRADIPAYIAAAKLTQHLVSLHQLGVGQALIDAVRALGLDLPAVSTRPVIHYMADRLKIPGGYHKTPPHQDWRSVQGSLDGVTVWAPLFDVGRADYPLEIAPGTHRRGLMDSTPDMPNYRTVAEAYDEGDFQPVLLNSGDAVIFSAFLLHRTGERGGPLVRTAFSFRFNNIAEPSFVRRGYPDRYVYRADPALVTPDFPSPADLASIFG